jgi:hypothetical protein
MRPLSVKKSESVAPGGRSLAGYSVKAVWRSDCVLMIREKRRKSAALQNVAVKIALH